MDQVVALGDVRRPAGGIRARPSTAAGSWRTGSSVRATRSSYQARICGQSVSSALAASSCRAAIAASIW
jgi:hypothetical protein